MNNIIFKTTLIKGAQGAKGDPGEGDSIPTQSVIAYEGQEIPEGYIRTDAPAEFQALETRLNNIIAHPVEGETTAEELVDVRVSAYGDTYDSAGDAVRGQVDILQNQIDRLLDNTIQGSGEGEIVSYENGSDILPMKSAKVYLEPKQDLHGYDFPWVGGAWNNILNVPQTSSTTFGNVTLSIDENGVCTLNGLCNQSNNFYINVNNPFVNGESYSFCLFSEGTFPSNSYVKAQIFDNTVSNGILMLYNNSAADEIATQTIASDISSHSIVLRVRIDNGHNYQNCKLYPMLQKGIQTSMSWAPWKNICPITGYTEAGLDISNANLWDETVLEGVWSNGERLEAANRICSNYIYVKGLNGEGQTPNGVRWVSSQNTPDFSAYDENKNYLYNLAYTEDTEGILVPIPEAAYYVTFNFNNSYGGTYLNDTALLRPITKTEYVAHEGKEYNVQIKNRNLLQLTLENIMNLNSDWDWTLEDGVLTCDKGEDAYKWEIYFKTNGLIRIHAIAQGTPGYDELFLPIPEGGYPSGTYYAKYTGGSDLLKVYIDVGQNIIVDEYEIIENQIRAASVVVSGLDSLLDDVCICKDREDLNLPIYIKGAPDDVTYGGWVDIATGELVVNMAKVDLSNFTWVNVVNNLYKTTGIPNIKYTSSNTEIGNGLAEKYKMHQGANMGNQVGCIAIDVSQVSVNYSNPSGEFVYELAEPITYQLTKQEVIGLLGDNNVYSKDGSVAVIYRQDTNLVIQDILNRLGA